jgi:galactokinase/mevalonate kinase-like predicted kinase
VIHRLDPHLFEDRSNHGRFTLFYTGITRLAKNILQDVVDNSNAMTPAYLFTIDRVRQLAREARDALSLRDMQMLARVINGSWGANILIHPGTSNDEVDALRYGTHGLWAGMKLLGAGGGGYALFLSESESQADALRDKLRRDFENEKARIVDFSLNPAGLQVSVS